MLVLVAIAAAWDVRSLTIPNALPIAIAALVVPAGLLSGWPVETWLMHLAAGVLALAVGLGLWVTRLMGGGDIKLYAAVSLWFTPGLLLWLTAWIMIAGGLLGGAVILWGLVSTRLPNTGAAPDSDPGVDDPAEDAANRLKTPVPYGVAILAGTLFTLFAYG